jgi:hypothetical protein
LYHRTIHGTNVVLAREIGLSETLVPLRTLHLPMLARNATILVATAVFCAMGFAQQSVTDLKSLVGKKAIAQRMPLYEPGTYKAIPTTYAGQEVTIIAFKAIAMPKIALSPEQLARLGAQQRVALQDAQNAGTLIVQFADGTKADTRTIMPSLLANYLEMVEQPPSAPAVTASSTPENPATQLLSPVIQSRPADELSDEEVKLALSGRGRDHWVSIEDMGLMAAQGNQVPTITLYMPEAVLARRGESAKKQFTQYEPPDEDKRRSLMIVAQGYAGKTITEGCTSITRVVLLSDPSGGIVEEAYLSEPLGEIWRNNFGASNHCQALRTKFSLDSVQKVRAAAPNGEFLVAVFAGTVKTKMYKIKHKHQSKLRRI